MGLQPGLSIVTFRLLPPCEPLPHRARRLWICTQRTQGVLHKHEGSPEGARVQVHLLKALISPVLRTWLALVYLQSAL